ncbi:aldose epimerase family protein [Variovorax rhizosphaerae]|uniref:Aldose 1-epimerase n=1 Tax=Variovorax rhizosphaerae TaxID=1836200 RepID=A0ABU8WKV4_9BURK
MIQLSERAFGRMPDGQDVVEYTLDNGRGLRLSAINYGGIVTALHVPDREGRSSNIVLDLQTLTDYVERNPNFGTIVGRFANRLAGGRFELDGVKHQVTLNNGPNSLHGGNRGFGKRWWQMTPVQHEGATVLELRYTSVDGEEGYPGEMRVTVRYSLGAGANEWRIDYEAVCDAPTIVNLSHHGYFNLGGTGSILDHRLTLHASRYAPVDATLIPTGLADVAGTPFDFRQPTAIGQRIRGSHPQLLTAKGYDHNWVLDRTAVDAGGLSLAARVEHDPSGRAMEVWTTEPGVQFYSGNFLDGSLAGSAGISWRQSDGLCLETQHFPDSPNHPEFPSTTLRPREVFRSSTVHRFGVC